MRALRVWFVGSLAVMVLLASTARLSAAPIFYSGDANGVDGLANVTDGTFGAAAIVYNGFTTPTGSGVTSYQVTSLFTNNLLDPTRDPLPSPTTANFTIRSGVSVGNPGVVVASGSGTVTPVLTGRTALGLMEYTLRLTGLNVSLLPGTNYVFNVTPVGQGAGTSLGLSFETTTSGLNSIGTSSPSFFSNASNTFQPTTSFGAPFGALSAGVDGNAIVSSPVPEPATFAVLGVGCLALVVRRRRVAA